MITIQDIRAYFRIETAVPDAIIQRAIDYVLFAFKDTLGQPFTDALNDPDSHAEEVAKYKMAMGYLVVTRLLVDGYVITGFGVVVKRDEYSQPINEEQSDKIGRSYVDNASTVLHTMDSLLGTTNVSRCIRACQTLIEGFFNKSKKHC